MKALGSYVGLKGRLRNHLSERVVRKTPAPMVKPMVALPVRAGFYDQLDTTLGFRGSP